MKENYRNVYYKGVRIYPLITALIIEDGDLSKSQRFHLAVWQSQSGGDGRSYSYGSEVNFVINEG